MSNTLVMIDDTDSGIKYSGVWQTDKGTQDNLGNFGAPYESTSRVLKGTGSFSYTFSGTYVGIFGSSLTTSNPSRSCTVDGQTIPNNNISVAVNWIMHCEINGLPDGKHTIVVTVPTANPDGYWFDFLMYIPSSSVSLTNAALMVQFASPTMSYGTGWTDYPPGTLANVNGASMTIQFTGRSMTWMGFYFSQLPFAATTGTYSVDGGSSFSFELNGSPSQSTGLQFNQRFFTTGLLPAGKHSVKVTYNGNSDTTPLSLYNIIVQNGASADVSVGGSIGASTPVSVTAPNSGGSGSSSTTVPSGSSSPSQPSQSVTVIGTGTSAVTVTVSNPNSSATTLPSSTGPGSSTGTVSGSGVASSDTPTSGNNGTSSDSDSGSGNSANTGGASSAIEKGRNHTGLIVGVVVGVVGFILLLLAFFLYRRIRKKRKMNVHSNSNLVQPFTSPPTTMSQLAPPPDLSDPSSAQYHSSQKNPLPANVLDVVSGSSAGRATQQTAPNKPWRWQTGGTLPAALLSTCSTPETRSTDPTSEPEVVLVHEDSGVRLPAGTAIRPGATVVEMPPTYTVT